MTPCKFGDVVLIPFPFTDLSTFKQRPALVVSADKFNRQSADVIVIAISSSGSGREKFDYRLNKTEQKAGGLLLPSSIKLGKIVTIDQRLIRKTIGCLPQNSMTKIHAALSVVIGG
jgi:mRNA interferase MazF